MAEITLKTVERVVTKKGTKMVFVTADDKDGVERKMSAFDEVWNEGWNPGDTVSVEIRQKGDYLNLFPTAKEVNTVRPAHVKTMEEKVEECWRMLTTLLNMAKASAALRERRASPSVPSPVDPRDVEPEEIPF